MVRYKLKAPDIVLQNKTLCTKLRKFLVISLNKESTLEEILEANTRCEQLLTPLGCDLQDVSLDPIQKKEKKKEIPRFDFELDPPIRAGDLYDESKDKNLIGRYIYLQEGDQELLDSFCNSWLKSYESNKNFFLVLDLETRGLNPVLETSSILLHCLSWDGENGIVFEHQKFDLTLYKKVLNTVPLANHNIKFDVKWLMWVLGVNPIIFWDTMVCAQIGWAGIFPSYLGKIYSLDNVVMQLVPPYRMSKEVRKEFYTKDPGTGFTRKQVEYAVRDAILTFKLVKIQYNRLVNHNLLDLWENLELPLLNIFAENELLGVPVNPQTADDLFNSKQEELNERLEKINQQICNLPPETRPPVGPKNYYNPKSSVQLPIILNSIGIRVPDTKGDSLEVALANHPHPLLREIIEFRTLFDQNSKVLKKICTVFLDRKTNCIFPVFNLCGAITGRLSAQDPPLHQIQEFMRCIVEAPEGWILIGKDYSQFEFRAAAAESNEPVLLDLFRRRAEVLPAIREVISQVIDLGFRDPDDFCKKYLSSKPKDLELMAPVKERLKDKYDDLIIRFSELDVHKVNAAAVFNIPVSTVTGEQRTVTKTLGYATLYGSQLNTIRVQLAKEGYIYSNNKCGEFITAFFETLPFISRKIKEVHSKIRNGASFSTILGRKKFIKLPPKYMTSEFAKQKADAERQTVNFLFQGANADAIKMAMLILGTDWKERYPTHLRPRVLINVHDELLVMCPEQFVEEVDAQMESVMVQCGLDSIQHRCPIEVSGTRSKVWKK